MLLEKVLIISQSKFKCCLFDEVLIEIVVEFTGTVI